jgi:hypothetical protein
MAKLKSPELTFNDIVEDVASVRIGSTSGPSLRLGPEADPLRRSDALWHSFLQPGTINYGADDLH